ncbi:hypothetical protein FBU59_005226, partial [Linderina macrospora]
GDFQSSGSLACPYVCSWDINDMQWSPMASSSLTGPVTDMMFVGEKLMVAGTFQNGSQPIEYLMGYNFGKSVWETVSGADSLPGPATVLAPVIVANNAKSFFVAGTDKSSGKPYLAHYDGSSFAQLEINLGSKSTIRGVTQTVLSRIPGSVLSSNARSALTRRDEDSAIPSGYALSISGDLILSGNKRASSAFFDGSKWAPFLSTVQSDGSAGYISSFFYENNPISVYEKKLMSTALVILIAVVIALGITFLIVLVGLAYVYFRNRREAAATALAAAAAIAAAAAGGAGTMKPPQMLAKSTVGTGYLHGSGMGVAGFGVGAGAMAAATGELGDDDDDRPRHAVAAGDRDTWDEDALMAASEIRYNNLAAKSSGRVASGSSTGLAGLATAAGRQAAVSSETYVEKHGNVGAGDQKRGVPDDSLDSIFESAAAEAEAEQAATAAAAAAAATTTTATANASAGATTAGEKSGTLGYSMPAPHHYDQRGNELSNAKPTTGSPQAAAGG